MGKIQVKFDNTLKQSDIIVRLTNSSKDESGDNYKNNQSNRNNHSQSGNNHCRKVAFFHFYSFCEHGGLFQSG